MDEECCDVVAGEASGKKDYTLKPGPRWERTPENHRVYKCLPGASDPLTPKISEAGPSPRVPPSGGERASKRTDAVLCGVAHPLSARPRSREERDGFVPRGKQSSPLPYKSMDMMRRPSVPGSTRSIGTSATGRPIRGGRRRPFSFVPGSRGPPAPQPRRARRVGRFGSVRPRGFTSRRLRILFVSSPSSGSATSSPWSERGWRRLVLSLAWTWSGETGRSAVKAAGERTRNSGGSDAEERSTRAAWAANISSMSDAPVDPGGTSVLVSGAGVRSAIGGCSD